MNFTILEIGHRTVKVFRGIIRRRRLIQCDSRFYEYSDPVSPRDIDNILSPIQIKRGEVLFLSFARTFFVMKRFSLPSVNYDEVESMVALKVRNKFFDVSPDSAYDFSIYNQSHSHSEILAFFSKDRSLYDISEVIKNHVGDNFDISFSSEALYRGVLYGSSSGVKISAANIMVINVDRFSVELVFSMAGKMAFSRVFFYSENTHISPGIHQTVELFNKDFPGVCIDAVFLAGKKKDMFEKFYMLGNKKIPVFGCEDKRICADSVLNEKGFSTAVARGLILSGFNMKYSFQPGGSVRQKRLKRKMDKINKWLRMFACLYFLVVAVFLCMRVAYFYRLRRSGEQLLFSKMPESIDNSQLDAEVALLRKYHSSAFSVCRILSELSNNFPEDVCLSFLSFGDDKMCVLKGRAASLDKMFFLVSKLKKGGAFSELELKSANICRGAVCEGVEFSARGLLSLGE